MTCLNGHVEGARILGEVIVGLLMEQNVAVSVVSGVHISEALDWKEVQC